MADIQKIVLTIALSLITLSNIVFAQDKGKTDTVKNLSPFDFGLSEATTDAMRYQILYNTHLKAKELGVDVDYSKIDALTIEVSENSLPIPLTEHNDFRGLKLTVKNSTKKLCLFEMVQPQWDSIEMDKNLVDGGDFSSIDTFATGEYLLQLVDEHPWVENRAGYSYGATRKDILVVRNGLAVNAPIASYSTDSTKLKTYYCRTDDKLKTIANLSITRDTSSTQKTYCFRIDGVNNLKISKISIATPNTRNMYADEAVTIINSANILVEDLTINGTYSRTSNYGYGIMMNNVWNSAFVRLKATANWGIFGTNNLNNTTLRNCDINRFDVHCYGRDAFIYNCKFSKLYNQFSSMYGTVLFDNCRFYEFVPVLIETSYNAYTGFDLTFKNCTFEASPLHNFLISVGQVNDQQNSRPELSNKCWPNINIQNLIVKVNGNVSKVILFYPKGKIANNVHIDYISRIKIDGLRMIYSDTNTLSDFVISNSPIITQKTINYDLKKIELIPSVDQMKSQAEKKYKYPGSLTFNLRKSNKDEINIANSRLNYNINSNSQYNIRYTNCQIGMVRNNTKTNGTKRHYTRCSLYLNNADDARYYIDNQAVYNKCTFIPCDPKMFVSFYGTANDIIIKDCKTTRKGMLFYHGRRDNAELKSYTVKGSSRS